MSRHFHAGRVTGAAVIALCALVIVVFLLMPRPTAHADDPPPDPQWALKGRWIDPPCAPNHPPELECSDWRWVHDPNDLTVHFAPEDAFLMPDGRVFLRWRCVGAKHRIWNPEDGSFQTKSHMSDGVQIAGCPGLGVLPDGRVMVAGGICGAGSQATCCPGENCQLWQQTCTPYRDWVGAFDFDEGAWSPLEPMPSGSWYPTLTTLPNGQVVAMGGRTGCGASAPGCDAHPAMDPTVYNPDTNSWSTWSGLPISDNDVFAANQVNYPRVFVVEREPEYTGDWGWRLLVYHPSKASTYLLDLQNEEWGESTSSLGWTAGNESAVMYRPGKVMRAGGFIGGGIATKEAEHIDLTPSGAKTWETLPEMVHERANHYLTVLPTGHVLATGGDHPADNPVFHAEWIDMNLPPELQQWTELADSPFPRLYHSVAVLLPDARVLTAGGQSPASGLESNGNIFEPPYLFNSDGTDAARPEIHCAPSKVYYGGNFIIDVEDGAVGVEDIVAVNLIRTGAATHGFDQNQRFVPLVDDPQDIIVNVEDSRIQVPTPANANIAPPGFYMLFLISSAGVPSEAKFVQVVPCPPCPDVNGDGEVNVFDLLDLLACWGPANDPECAAADLDSNGTVNVFDLLELLANWGRGPCESCDVECVPETYQDCWNRYHNDVVRYEACCEWVVERETYFPE